MSHKKNKEEAIRWLSTGQDDLETAVIPIVTPCPNQNRKSNESFKRFFFKPVVFFKR